MKNIILILILVGIGAWYYCDKNGGIAFLSENAKQADPRIDAIKARAEKYYPTRLDDRDRWINTQISSMYALDKPMPNIPAEVHSELLKEAELQFPENYSKRLSFVKNQCTAYLDIKNTMFDSSFSDEEKSMLYTELAKAFVGDYVKQRNMLAQIFEVYGIIKSKSMQMAPSDFKKLSGKIMARIAQSPNDALLFFEDQSRARHNFLTKQLPASNANMRAEIEKNIPDDFVAQLAELNARMDNLRSARVVNFEANISKNAQEFFKKYIYLVDTSARTYNLSFAMMNGKKVAIFPSEMVQHTGGVLELNLGGGEKIHFDKLFMSKDSGFGIVIVEGENRIDTIKFANKAQTMSKDSIDVEIVGVNADGKKATVSAKIENGKTLIIEPSKLTQAKSWLVSGALIIEKENGVALGLFDADPVFDSNIYATYENPTLIYLLSLYDRVSLWSGLKEAVSLAKKNVSMDYKYRIVYLEDIKKFARLDAKKYEQQKKMLSEMCAVNMGAMSFMLEGSYGADSQQATLKDIANKFNSTFIKGDRCSVSMLHSNFLKYMQTVRLTLRNKANLVRENTDDFYYDFYAPAIRQMDLYKRLDLAMGNTIAQAKTEKILHQDIAMAIRGNTYIPPKKINAPIRATGAISGGLRLGNKGVKKDYNK